MSKKLTQLICGVMLLLAGVVLVVMVGMRTKSQPVLDAVRRFNKTVGNPRQMKSAGTPGAYAGVIRHIGRTTGRAYETPVGTEPTGDGFLIALPYGLNTDWLKNVLASGSATIVHDGSTHEVDRPEVVPTATVASLLPPQQQRTLRMFGVNECLRVRTVVPAAAG